MKYAEEMYYDSGIYGDHADDDTTHHQEKIVRCRKPHKCSGCGAEIHIEDHALRETGFMDGKPVSCYTCLPCIEAWLVESGQVDDEGNQEGAAHE